jgi:hypothetical protein
MVDSAPQCLHIPAITALELTWSSSGPVADQLLYLLLWHNQSNKASHSMQHHGAFDNLDSLDSFSFMSSDFSKHDSRCSS